MGYREKTLAKNEAFALAHIERQEGNVITYKNHPSIIVWSLGNEAGYGPNFERAYDWVKAYDATRPCQFEQARQDGKTDIFCPMYLGYDDCVKYAKGDNPRPLIQCEYAHAMGNSMGGFKEYWDIIRKYPKYQGGYIWDFVDQGLRDTNPVTGKEIFTYGGDYGRYPATDHNFNCNGLIAPDRRLNPHAYEVGYYYQNAWITDQGLKDGKFEVYNENFFKSLDDLELVWKVRKHSGTIDISGIAPQQRKAFADKALADMLAQVAEHHPNEEVTVNFEFRSREAQPLIEQGQVLARQQFIIQPYPFPEITGQPSASALTCEETTSYVKLETSGTTLTRAPTDNDYGAQLQRRFAVWKEPQLKVSSFKVDGGTVTVGFDMPDVKGQLTMTYTLNADGEVIVRQQLKAAEGTEVSPMFRYGVQLLMPRQYDAIQYYGRGPVENYIDRNTSEFLGIYNNNAQCRG